MGGGGCRGGGFSMCSSQHLIILTRLAQLRLHKATHRGIFLNARDVFSCHKERAQSDGNEGVRAIAFPQRQQWVD